MCCHGRDCVHRRGAPGRAVLAERTRYAIFAMVVSFVPAAARGDEHAPEPASESNPPQADPSADHAAESPAPRWKVELKRQDTDRSTEGESSKTTVRLEAYPSGTPLSMLRLDLPFPDDRTDFLGSPFDPHLGDISVKAEGKAFQAGGLPLSPFLELSFPTANPQSLGQGKYQVTLGVETSVPLASFKVGATTHKVSFAPLIEQGVSVAGDKSRKDINYTKLELGLRDDWRNYTLKLTLKPVIDWEQSGQTGAVTELEGGVNFERGWYVRLMLGHRTWGGSVPSTYGTRAEFTLGRMF